MNKKYLFGTMALAAVVTLVTAVPAFAETDANVSVNASVKANWPAGMMQRTSDSNGQNRDAQERGPGMMRPFIVGKVSAVSGNTITVVGNTGFGKTVTATTTYTVDATNAKVTKANATSTVASIVVGDTVAVQGTITGTNVVATMIRDGVAGGPGMGFGFGRNDEKGPGKMGTSTPAFTGNGQPIIAGKISAISSSTISIANSSNVTYTIDATNAKILLGNKVSDISTLKVGDTILAQGSVNGTSIVATTVIDQTKPANSGNNNPRPGFFGGIGQFFMHLFGF